MTIHDYEIRDLHPRLKDVTPDTYLLAGDPNVPQTSYKVYFGELCRSFRSLVLGPSSGISGVGKIGQATPHEDNKYYLTELADWDALVPGSYITLGVIRSLVLKKIDRTLREIKLDHNFLLQDERDFLYQRPYITAQSQLGQVILTSTDENGWEFSGKMSLVKGLTPSTQFGKGDLSVDFLDNDGIINLSTLSSKTSIDIYGDYIIYANSDLGINSEIKVKFISSLQNATLNINAGLKITKNSYLNMNALYVGGNEIGGDYTGSIFFNQYNLSTNKGAIEGKYPVEIRKYNGSNWESVCFKGTTDASGIRSNIKLAGTLACKNIGGQRVIGDTIYGGEITKNVSDYYQIDRSVFDSIKVGYDLLIDNNFFPITVMEKIPSSGMIRLNHFPNLTESGSTFNYTANAPLDEFALSYDDYQDIFKMNIPRISLHVPESYDDEVLATILTLGQEYKFTSLLHHVEEERPIIVDYECYLSTSQSIFPGGEGAKGAVRVSRETGGAGMYLIEATYTGIVKPASEKLDKHSIVGLGVAKRIGSYPPIPFKETRFMEVQKLGDYWGIPDKYSVYFNFTLTIQEWINDIDFGSESNPSLIYFDPFVFVKFDKVAIISQMYSNFHVTKLL